MGTHGLPDIYPQLSGVHVYIRQTTFAHVTTIPYNRILRTNCSYSFNISKFALRIHMDTFFYNNTYVAIATYIATDSYT